MNGEYRHSIVVQSAAEMQSKTLREKAVVQSADIAKVFEKEHRDILKAIRIAKFDIMHSLELFDITKLGEYSPELKGKKLHSFKLKHVDALEAEHRPTVAKYFIDSSYETKTGTPRPRVALTRKGFGFMDVFKR